MPECPDVVLPSHALPAMWVWGALFLLAGVFELWAVWTHHRTLSQAVQQGPRWFRWSVVAGLALLILHLLV